MKGRNSIRRPGQQQEAKRQEAWALKGLRDGVERATRALGSGFLAHPQNAPLREHLRSGELDAQDYYRQLLRLVYRLIFLFAAEDRGLLHPPDVGDAPRERYARYYSTARLRRLAGGRQGWTKRSDLYEGLKVVFAGLGREGGCPEFGLPFMGSFLFSAEACPDLDRVALENASLLEAVRALAFTAEGRVVCPDYRNIGAEELGSVYESLLELHPEIELEAATFVLGTTAGHERKITGSYYTPSPLVSALLDSALEPVLEEAAHAPDPEAAILDLKVLDPACGSGHFLVAAAHRIARRLAALRTGEEEPSPEAHQRALRDAISRCLYGIDVNPMAVELCKISLWLEAMDPGRPLSFLEHHIVCGNSLLGTTPRLLAGGIPDEAFTALEGDDKEVVRALRKRNLEERKSQDLRRKQEAWEKLKRAREAAHAKFVADAWCAAFVIRKTKGSPVLTDGVLRRLMTDPQGGDPELKEEIRALAERYRFLHPHLAFPTVFRLPADGEEPENAEAGWSGGFDVVLGNPPWGRVKIERREWFAVRHPAVAAARNAAERRRLIAKLREEDPALYAEWLEALRTAYGESHFLRNSGRYPLCGRRDVNTYAVFAELMRNLTTPAGRTGIIVPSGIATDDTTKHFFRDIVEHHSLVSLFDFENRGIFPAISSRMRFCLVTLTGSARVARRAEFIFFAHDVADLAEDDRRLTLTPEDFALINPNTRTCPTFRFHRDAELTKAIYERVPPFLHEEGGDRGNPWHVSFKQGLLNMDSDSELFRTREQLLGEGWHLDGNVFVRGSERYVPLYEAKMVHHFDHRFGDYAMQAVGSKSTRLPDVPVERLADPDYRVLPRYWVPERKVEERLEGCWDRGWLLGWRNICSSTNERTMIASIIPRTAVSNSFLLALLDVTPRITACLLGNLDSFVLDYVVRQKLGGTNLKYHVFKQLAILPPSTYQEPAAWRPERSLADWISERVLELVYTAWDLEPFARDLGYDGPPFRWDPARRELIRAELDAAFFRLYGLSRAEVGYVMDTFPLVRCHDEQKHGDYRTKRLILEQYDALISRIWG